jgi:hypothetical protein
MGYNNYQKKNVRFIIRKRKSLRDYTASGRDTKGKTRMDAEKGTKMNFDMPSWLIAFMRHI